MNYLSIYCLSEVSLVREQTADSAAVMLAYANGANDNFKGVATRLAAVFSGKGLVPDQIAAAPEFLAPVGLGAAFTI